MPSKKPSKNSTAPLPPPLPFPIAAAAAAAAAAASSSSTPRDDGETPRTAMHNHNLRSISRSRFVAWWTVMWFLCAASAAALLIASELFQDYRPAFPLEPACALGLALHILAGIIVVRIGVIRHAPHFRYFQPFAGGITFVATSFCAYTLYSLSIVTLYLYFLAPTAVPARGALAAAGIMSAFSSWLQFMSLQYYRAEKITGVSSSPFSQQSPKSAEHHHHHHHQSHPMNEARGGAVMILMQAVLAGAAQWHHERGVDDVARAIGFLLLMAHVLTAAVCHFALGIRHVPKFRWFVPFSGKLVDVAAQAVSWTGFGASVLGMRVMLEPGSSTTRGGIGWGFFGAVGVAANIGLLIQMRSRARAHREEQKQRGRSASIGGKKRPATPGTPSSPSSSSAAAHLFARGSRTVLTMLSILIALYSAALDEPHVVELLTAYTDIRQWRLSNRVLLHCSISFPVVTHITGVVLRAYSVRNPFASRLAGTEFVALQLLGWVACTSAFMLGVVTRGVADPWTAALALLAQLMISNSVTLVEMKASRQDEEEDAAAAAAIGGGAGPPSQETSDQSDDEGGAAAAYPSPLRQALARMPMRGLDEIFNGIFLTGLVGSLISILARVGCDFAVSDQKQRPTHHHETEVPFFVVVAASTLLWAFCVPMLQFSVGGVLMRPFQGPPLYAALQALGWTAYIFILVLLSLVSVDVATATTDAGHPDFSRYHPFQFTSQGALMLIPVFLVTVSAFFSNELDPQQQQPQEQQQQQSSPIDDDHSSSPSETPRQGDASAATDPLRLMSDEELLQLKKMRSSLHPSSHPHLVAAMDQMLARATTSASGRTPTSKHPPPSTSPATVMSSIKHHSLNKSGSGGGDAIAAGIVVVCCLAIASLALFVAAEHMGRDAPRPVHVGILGVTALAASAMGAIAAHARIGPALHGADAYRWWMPFQGGAAFVTWQFVGFGTMCSSLLLFLVDVLRRRNMALMQQDGYTGGSWLFGGSSLVPSGLLGGLAPVLVLCSTFTFDKTRTALDQRGTVIYENAEALLVFVVLGASYLLAATSELWLRNDWELATIPLLLGSCAALFTMPVAVIAIRKAADLQRFRSGDTVEALDMREWEEEETKKKNNNENAAAAAAAAEDLASMAPSQAALVSLKTSLVGAPLVLVECIVLAICAAIPLSLVYGSYHLYHNYFDALPAIVKSYQIALVVVQFILLCLFWWLGMLQWATATASAFVTYSIPLVLAGWVALFPAIRPHALGAWWFLVELVLGMVPPYWIQPVLTLHDCIMLAACSWQALLIFNSGGPIGFVSLFSAGEYALAHVAPMLGLERFAASVLSASTAHGRWYTALAVNSAATPDFSLLAAMGRMSSSSSSSSSSNLTAATVNTTAAGGSTSTANIPPYMALFGNTCSLQLENAFLFLLLVLYKFRYLRAPEETGRLRSDWMRRMLRIFFTPGLERYFSMRLIVVKDDVGSSGSKKAKDNSSSSSKKSTTDKSNFLSWHDEKKRPRNVIFGWHPHGIFAFTVPWLALSELWEKAAGGVLPKDVVPFAANIIFNIPIMRDWSMWLGARPATRTAIVHTITDKRVAKSAMIVPGGQAELIENEVNPKVMRLIGFHVGFIRIAVQQRVAPCPIMGFGENNILDNVRAPEMQKFCLRKLQFPFPILPMGFAYSWLPRRVPVTPVVGRPVDIEAVWRNTVAPAAGLSAERLPETNTPAEKLLVDAVAECYYDELTRIFYKHRAEAGFPDTDLHLIQKK